MSKNQTLEQELAAERLRCAELARENASLRDQATHLRFAMESTGMGVLDIDIENDIVEVSDRWLELTGYERGEITARQHYQVLIHPEDADSAVADLEALYSGQNKVHEAEYRLLHKGGHWIRVLTRRIVPERDKHGKPKRMIATHIDITDSKQAEDDLRDSETRFRVLADGAPVILFVDGPDGGVQFVNRTYCEFFGTTPEEVEGGKWHPLIHDDDASEYLRAFLESVEAQVSFRVEVRLRRFDGAWRHAETIAEPRFSGDGQYLGHVGIINDVTERKLADKERERLQDQLLNAQKLESVGRLAGGVAHDFNNMLAVIMGGVDLALRQAESDRLHATLIEVRTAAQRSADLTRQLLAFARQQPIKPIAINLEARLDAILAIVRRLVGERIALSWEPSPSLWPIVMDSVQLDQVVTNLSVNARDAIEDVGAISIAANNCSFDEFYCATHQEHRPGDFVCLSVADNGCGIDKSTLAHLFEPFFTTKNVGEGTGLGLATVYGIVQQNKGFIQVTSEVGVGTTFNIYLPRHLGVVAPEPSAPVVARAVATETILVVEDEPALLRTFSLVLEEMGYQVLAAVSPIEAIHLAEEHKGTIDLLLTDVIMPQMNGRELVETIQVQLPGLKHIFMSGYTADVIATQGVMRKGVSFLEKPFSSDELGEKVRLVLDGLG
tara:strand:+ start:153508 stop:155511 length:2004 start_codon:yes stop_codon:yes gene_type:complete